MQRDCAVATDRGFVSDRCRRICAVIRLNDVSRRWQNGLSSYLLKCHFVLSGDVTASRPLSVHPVRGKSHTISGRPVGVGSTPIGYMIVNSQQINDHRRQTQNPRRRLLCARFFSTHLLARVQICKFLSRGDKSRAECIMLSVDRNTRLRAWLDRKSSFGVNFFPWKYCVFNNEATARMQAAKSKSSFYIRY